MRRPVPNNQISYNQMPLKCSLKRILWGNKHKQSQRINQFNMNFYIAPIKWIFPGSRLPTFFRQREGEDVDRWVLCLLLSMLCRCMLCRPSIVRAWWKLHVLLLFCYYAIIPCLIRICFWCFFQNVDPSMARSRVWQKTGWFRKPWKSASAEACIRKYPLSSGCSYDTVARWRYKYKYRYTHIQTQIQTQIQIINTTLCAAHPPASVACS